MARNNETESSSINLISSGTYIEGNIKSEGDIRVDGTVVGSIQCKGKLVVGNTGKIEGDVKCNNADVSGELKVRIAVTELLSLKSSAKLSGEIATKKLAIEPGAEFSGTCTMGNNKPQHSNNGQEKRETQPKEAKPELAQQAV